ncbi:MAG: hypothetical protein LC768_15375 [Acidobacteria bacterium]|nr:hypothetical protein [Acidobacteriota bacterium]
MKSFLNLVLIGYCGLIGFGQTEESLPVLKYYKPNIPSVFATNKYTIQNKNVESDPESNRIILIKAANKKPKKHFARSVAFNSKPEIYIPADRRHKGLSRFDLIPFTDRRKGDPDRYRAVNPKYVKRENGHYYFALNVKAYTHYFDENLKDKGVLPELNVNVDLTRTKTAKASDDKMRKYIYVKDKGYILSGALMQSSDEIKAGRWFSFPIKAGEHNLYDGTGIVRGKLAADLVRLNYGLQKEIKGETYYYAFSTKLKIRNEIIGASGWIKASAIEAGNDPQFDTDFVKKMQMPTAANDTFAEYEITGGNPQEAMGRDANGAAKYKFGYANKNGNFIAYKVLPKIPLDGNQSIASTDYLKRSDAVINLGFNVAGVSNDTFRIDGANRPLIFHRSSEGDATALIDLFYPKDAVHDGEKVVAQMIFVYGYVGVADDKRWGWIPLDALKLKSKKSRLK